MKTEKQATGESAENYVTEIFNRLRWSASKPKDFGLDLYVETFDPLFCGKGPVFGVQVKGTEHPQIAGSCIVSRSIEPRKISEWLNTNIAVLFVWCDVKANEVAAWYTWVDDYVYGGLQLPFGSEVKEPVTFRIPLTSRLTEHSANDLRAYLNAWAPARKTADNISAFLRRQTDVIQRATTVRHGVFKWELFSLPIRYRRRGNYAGPPAKDLNDWLRQAGRTVLLLGRPASGKTITVKRLLSNAPADLIPVELRPMPPATTAELIHELQACVPILAEKHFDYLESQRRVLVLVDGLSEFQRSEDVCATIADMACRLTNTRFVVTCRTAHYERRQLNLPGFEEWEIVDLDSAAQDQFLLDQHDQARYAAMQNAFQQWPELRGLCANQFLFLIAAEVIPESGASALVKTGLYRTFLLRYMNFMNVQEPELMIDRLGAIAWRMRKSASDRVSALTSQLTEWLREELGSQNAASFEHRLYVQGLIEKAGDRCRFFQETLQEFLCAHDLVQKPVLPCGFENSGGSLWYDGVEINDMIREFYIELACLKRVL